VQETPSLRARLLGQFDLRLDGRQLGPIESGRSRSLLASVLLHPDVPQSRQHLAFLLWPDSSEAQARTNLRNVLHTLRRSDAGIERFLEVTARTVQRRGDVPCWVDVAEFNAALAQAQAAEAGSDRMVAELRSAVDLYAGDLLEGCYDEWLIEERERLRDRYLSAVRRLTDALAERGEHAEAIRLGRELLRGDALHEDTYRLLMRMHEAAGDRAGAVRVYHECAATLQRELGVDPSPATQRAYAALMRTANAEAPLRMGGTELVGREREWDRLTRCWRDAEEGRSHLVLVTGEPGIGKTRLVEELTAWCTHRGALVASARAYPTEGDLGYGMVISWLRSDPVAAQLRRAGVAELAELTQLLPELGERPPTGRETLDAAEQRRRLFDAVARALVAADRPTLLVADDAQWCDEQTLQLVHYLVRVHAAHPLVVVATVRREELDDLHPLRRLIDGLQVLDRVSEIALDRLSLKDTAALARQLAGSALDAEALYAETEGNPLFIVEAIRAGAGRRIRLSPKLQAVIDGRLRQLTPPARDLLGVAAAVGRAFTAELVGSVAGTDDVTLVRGLDELWRRGIIREHGSDAYDFSHGRIRDVAYESLSPAVRRRTHVLVAEALQRLHAGDANAVSGQVAGHYDRAGHVDLAVDWYARAARRAQRLHADREAVAFLARAHELVGAVSDETHRRRELEILSALPAALGGIEGFTSERMTAFQNRAIEVAGLLGVEPEPPLLRSLVISRLCRDDFDDARAAAERLLDSARRAGDEGLRIEAEYLLAISAFWGGQFGTARDRFERVVASFTPADRTEHLLRFGQDPAIVCLSRLANTLWFLGHDDHAQRACDEALAMAVAVGHPFSRTTAYMFAALLAVDLREPDRLRGYVGVLEREDLLARPTELGAAAMRGYLDVGEGRVDEGLRRIRGVIDRNGPLNAAPGSLATLRRVLVAAAEVAGDPKVALSAADEALNAAGSRIWEAELRRVRAHCMAELGADKEEVRTELAQAARVARRQGAAGLERRLSG
jgi:DNA-binding SARP family transcriptional activator